MRDGFKYLGMCLIASNTLNADSLCSN